MRGEVFPVFDDGLVFEKLAPGQRDFKKETKYTNFVYVLALSNEIFQTPLSEHAKLGCDETDFAGSPPDYRWCATVRDKLFEFLHGKSRPASCENEVIYVRVVIFGNISRRILRPHPSWAFAEQ